MKHLKNNLSDTNDIKFIESIEIDDYEVWTDSGWKDASAIHKTIEYKVFNITLSNGLTISCADKHIFITSEYDQVYAKDSIGFRLITEFGIHEVVKIEENDHYENMYDLSVDSSDHTYYTNSILSHNTTVATAIILHFVLFAGDKKMRVYLLSNNAAGSREILDRIKMAYEYLPRFLQLGVREWNKGSVTFDNNAKIVAAASSSASIRGRTASMLYIDEAAFVTRWESFAASVLPVLSSGKDTRTIFTSTPNGLNHFYEYCEGAKNKTNDYHYIEVPWYKVPGRDEAWKKDILSNINNDEDRFRVEYECSFEGSSTTLITGSVLKRLKSQDAVYKDQGLSQYEKPILGKMYFAIVDVSWGKGLDYSTIQIMKVEENNTFTQVAKYSTNTLPVPEFSGIVYSICKLYNDSYLLVETNNLGNQLVDLMFMDYSYENIVYTKPGGSRGRTLAFGPEHGATLGLYTSQSIKRIGCQMFKLLLEENRLKIIDEDTIKEIKTFSKHNNSYRADEGHHDDLVMPLVLFSWMVSDKNFKAFTDSNVLLDMSLDSSPFASVMPLLGYSNGLESTNTEIEYEDGNIWSLVSPERLIF